MNSRGGTAASAAWRAVVGTRLRCSLGAAVLGAASLAGLGGCGKASETAAEKLIEAQAAKEGVKAKVDIQDGQTRITTTDAQGQTSQLQAGGASISAADLGVAIYPGAQIDPATANRIDSPQGRMVMAQLASSDPADKVAAFYREQLKPRSTGKQFMDASSGDGGATLMLGDDLAKTAVQIVISPQDSGSTVHITHTQTAKTP